jgi:hypothetical protein
MFGKKFKHLHSQKISPTTKISIPLIWEPICNGGRKITVYNTQRGCDVMVYLTRNEGMMTFTDEVARGNGNGNFVTMELYWESNNIKLLNTFEPGDRVWAVQSASGIVSDPSNEITVRVGNGAPSYEPLKWKYNVTKNNCYNYACNIYSSGKLKTALALPGYGHSTPN